MATTNEQLQARLDALEAAIDSGALSVAHDGKTVTYRSLDDMVAIAARLRRQLEPTSRRYPRTLTTFKRG